MAQEQEVVIVGDDGTEHVFPAGFDPKRAADIVRGGPAAPQEPEGGPISRFSKGVIGMLTAPVSTAYKAVTDPKGTVKAIEEQSAKDWEEAKKQYQAGDYGHAAAHGIASFVPPFGVVTQAADKLREGDVAGGLGEAVGAGLTPKVYGGVARGARALPKAAGDVLVRNPKIGTEILGGAPGAVVGGMAGGAMGEPVAGVIVGRTIGRQLVPEGAVEKLGRKLGGRPRTEDLLKAQGVPAGQAPKLVKGGGMGPQATQMKSILEEAAKSEKTGAMAGETLPYASGEPASGLPEVGLDTKMLEGIDDPLLKAAVENQVSSGARLRELSQKPILTPAEIQELDQLKKLAGTISSEVGTSYAAYGKE